MIKGKTRVVLLVTAGLFSVIAWADLRIGTSLNRFAWVTKKETVSIQPDRTDAVVMAQAEEKIKEVRSGDGKARLVRVIKELTGGEVNYSLKVISGGWWGREVRSTFLVTAGRRTTNNFFSKKMMARECIIWFIGRTGGNTETGKNI